MLLKNVRDRLSVQSEQNGAQYRPLGNFRLKWDSVHCHANILPSTGQENNIAQPKKISSLISHLIFYLFFTTELLFKCHFVVWQRRLHRKFADCVFVLIKSILLNLLCIWILKWDTFWRDASNGDRLLAVRQIGQEPLKCFSMTSVSEHHSVSALPPLYTLLFSPPSPW